MPETKKKPRKPRAKRAPAKKSKKGLKQKQKQKQQVTVSVSAGGSGGGGFVPIPSFVPIPQSPSIDYGLISQLLRPAATTDVPIREAAPVAEMPFVRPAEPPSLVESYVERPPSQQSKSASERARPTRRAPFAPLVEGSELFPNPIDLSKMSRQQIRQAFEIAQNPQQEFLFIPKKKGGGEKE